MLKTIRLNFKKKSDNYKLVIGSCSIYMTGTDLGIHQYSYNFLPVDAVTEAAAEFHIEAVFVLAAEIPSAVFLYALDSYD